MPLSAKTPPATAAADPVRLLAGSDLASNEPVDRALRDVLGCFATGVTVLTALAADGNAIGVTINSFNSVSLDPPLILWSLSRVSPRLTAFQQAAHYAVNVLAAQQQTISDSFAARGGEPFAGLRVRHGLGGAPLLEGCAAWIECSHYAQYPGGDHLIFVGRVERFSRHPGGEPLIFHGGRYCQLRRK